MNNPNLVNSASELRRHPFCTFDLDAIRHSVTLHFDDAVPGDDRAVDRAVEGMLRTAKGATTAHGVTRRHHNGSRSDDVNYSSSDFSPHHRHDDDDEDEEGDDHHEARSRNRRRDDHHGISGT